MAKGQKSIVSRIILWIGVLLAIVMGLGAAMGASWADDALFVFLLIVIGILIGIKNISSGEVANFLMGTIALILATTVANLSAIDKIVPKVGTFIQASLANFIVIIGVAAVIVSFKAVYNLAK